MIMGFVLEIFFTASLSICLAFLFAKLVSVVGGANEEKENKEDCFVSSRSGKEVEVISNSDDGYVVKEVDLINKDLQVEKKIGFIEKVSKNFDDFDSSLVNKEEDEVVEYEERFNVEEINKDEVVEVEVGEEEDKEVNLVDEIPEKDEVSGIELKEDILERDDSIEVSAKSCEVNEEFDVKLEKDEVEKKEEEVFSEDEDWEGIEKSEVEKVFSSASKFVNCGTNNELVSKLGSDAQMQLYALHKVAMEGPCRQPAPLALKVSARAKWNSWQQLGNMTPEVAMDQYVKLLSYGIPGWMGENLECTSGHEQDRDNVAPEAEGSRTAAHDTLSTLHEPSSSNDRKPAEFQSVGAGSDVKSL